MNDNPAVDQRAGGDRDQSGFDNVGKEMIAGGNPAQSDQGPETQRRAKRDPPAAPGWQQKREADHRESQRGVPRSERAVACALIGRHQWRGEVLDATKLLYLIGAGAAPII